MAGTAAYSANQKEISKKYVLFANYISEINNIQVDDIHGINAVMLMFNLIEYNDIHSKKSGRLWQYSRIEPSLDYCYYWLIL